MNLILIPIVLPLATALLLPLISEKTRHMKETLAAATSAVSLLGSFLLLLAALYGLPLRLDASWAGGALRFTLLADGLSAAVTLAVSLFSFLTALYSSSFEKKGPARWFYFNLLLTQSFAAGAALSESLVSMLFFWEGLPVMLYFFIALSAPGRASGKTAIKAFLIHAAAGLCLLAGVAMTAHMAGTHSMAEISANKLPLTGWSSFACALMLAGAVARTGAPPFHSWIPDAAADSSAPFMAYVPAALDKLLGGYLLARVSVHLFAPGGAMQPALMTLGALTVLAAGMAAIVQTDYRRLLSWLAVGQAGYMMLGIGTPDPAGAAGGLFQMLNGAVCTSCLFMTAGSVERRAGTADLAKLGGLFGLMPVTGLCFLVSAAAISGIAPFNGYFSWHLICAGALRSGHTLFFIAAAAGAGLTLASLLKLGHAVFFGKRPQELERTAESGFSTLFPMAALAALCAVFGFGARVPADFFLVPALSELGLAAGGRLSGFRPDPLFWTSAAVVLAAVIGHVLGAASAQGRACGASDHIRRAPVLKHLYELAETRFFDPYEQLMRRWPRRP